MADREEDYKEGDYQYDDYSDRQGGRSSMKGYKIVIAILIVVLLAVAGLFFWMTGNLKAEYREEREALTRDITTLRTDMDGLKTENEAISYNLEIEKGRADSLIEALEKERKMSLTTIRRYEKELGTMRSIMKTYVHQIDSLNTLNQKLISENVTIKKQITSERLRADVAEERAQEMNVKIRQGSKVIAREISMSMLNNNDREVSRANRATRLRVDFTLSANSLANPGDRPVYVRITSPEGYIMANSAGSTFLFEGDPFIFSATRDVDYQGADLDVSIYYNEGGIISGTYRVEVYMDGMLIGSSQTILR